MNLQEDANILRAEAKTLLNSAFPHAGAANDAVDRAVDCIIMAAMLEMSAINAAAARVERLELPTTPNP